MGNISITKKMYGWSKYGGARKGLVKTNDEVWYCQCCGEQQVREIPGYMYAVNDREFLRLCAKCWAKTLLGEALKEIRFQIQAARSLWKEVENLRLI